ELFTGPKRHSLSARLKAGCWTTSQARIRDYLVFFIRKGSTWADANTIMYAKIAGTDYEDVGKFVAMAIKQMEKVHGKPKEKVDTGKTGDGQPYFINEYPATKSYSQWERVAYIQLPKAVAYIVLSSRDE